MKNEKTEAVNLPVRIPKGTDPIFVLAITVDDEGRASIAYNYKPYAKISKCAEALKDFADNLARQHADA